MTKKYKVVNKLRFTIFVVIMILLITTFANFALGLNTANSLTRLTYMDYEITAGDTLWTIAETYMTDVSDIREAVYELCQLNDIRAGELYVGMTIQIPIQSV
ncbi:MAG: LysM peptidoglycan-binding domain-containing protein [Firmicutes bacterium]|nr:LysM peptidoglycan-binding domain-containing protein [Bacillota bacterium]MDY5855996.1 LysM peptidoglycan-binding domain-containing protein [Anaerovoracaceae bacterium]